MFKELTYFEFLEDGLNGLQDEKAELNRRLIDAYSPPEKVFCSLKEQIDNILTEEEQLQQIIAVILQQVQASTFLPRQVERTVLESLATHALPVWFSHVLEMEYTKHRPELDRYAFELAKLHELKEKRKLMRDERQSLETIYRRTLVISALQKSQHFSDIDIMQDVNHLRNRIKHVRKAFQHFCSQVAAKVREFVDQLIEKSMRFSKEKTAVVDVFKRSQMKAASYFPIAELPEQSFKKAQVSSVRSHLNSPREYRKEIPKDTYNQYYSRAEKISIESKPTVISNEYQHDHALKNCRNHQQVGHRHTCEKGKDWLRSVKSQQKMGHSPTDRFSFRRFVPSYF